MQYTEWTPELADALAEPFAPAAHKTKTLKGSSITFVSVHEYMTRLNSTVGPQGWRSAVRLEDHGGKLVAVVSLTILGVTKENVGDEDEDKDSFGTAATNAFAQAFKRACAGFGLGAYLYDERKREAAKRGAGSQNGNGGRTQPRASGGKATDKQIEYLGSLMRSSVFTEEERDAVAKSVKNGDREKVSKAIERAKAEIDSRKAAA